MTPAALRPQPQPKQRALAAIVDEPEPLFVVAVHGPLGASSLRGPFNRRILRFLARWRGRPGVPVGDANTGRGGVDEESPVFNAEDDAWTDGLHAAGWIDAHRYLHGDQRAYTCYSPHKGNGFRLDHAFVHESLVPRISRVRYDWATAGGARDGAPSDHAAIVVAL